MSKHKNNRHKEIINAIEHEITELEKDGRTAATNKVNAIRNALNNAKLHADTLSSANEFINFSSGRVPSIKTALNIFHLSTIFNPIETPELKRVEHIANTIGKTKTNPPKKRSPK